MSNLSGVFPARIKNYTTIAAKSNGNAQVAIQLDIKVSETEFKQMTWYGSFAGGAKDHTLKTLIYCGLHPNNFNQLVNLVHGVESNLLDLNKDLTATLVVETKVDQQTGMEKQVTKVAWINDPANAPSLEKIDMGKNQQFFNAMNFDQDLVRLAAEINGPKNQGSGNMQAPQNTQMGAPNNQMQSGMQTQMPGQMQMNNGQHNMQQDYQTMNQGQNMSQGNNSAPPF